MQKRRRKCTCESTHENYRRHGGTKPCLLRLLLGARPESYLIMKHTDTEHGYAMTYRRFLAAPSQKARFPARLLACYCVLRQGHARITFVLAIRGFERVVRGPRSFRILMAPALTCIRRNLCVQAEFCFCPGIWDQWLREGIQLC